MSQTAQTAVAVIIDIGKNSFHIVGHDGRGAIAASLPAQLRRRHLTDALIW